MRFQFSPNMFTGDVKRACVIKCFTVITVTLLHSHFVDNVVYMNCFVNKNVNITCVSVVNNLTEAHPAHDFHSRHYPIYYTL